jgi:hypothetical protein
VAKGTVHLKQEMEKGDQVISFEPFAMHSSQPMALVGLQVGENLIITIDH